MKYLCSFEQAQALDHNAQKEWNLQPLQLVEAAGTLCALKFLRYLKKRRTKTHIDQVKHPFVLVLAGTGNNAADALVMLKQLLFQGFCDSEYCKILFTKAVENDPNSPLYEALHCLRALDISDTVFQDAATISSFIHKADIIIDGLSGTGLRGPARNSLQDLITLVNTRTNKNSLLVSIDIPSGLHSTWKSEDPIIQTDICLSILPAKQELFYPGPRAKVRQILSISGVFPKVAQKLTNAVLWINTKKSIYTPGKLPLNAYKHTRGVVGLFAGQKGSPGAACLCASAAQAAGAGLIHLFCPDEILDQLTSIPPSILRHPQKNAANYYQSCDALLAGPGYLDSKKIVPMLLKLFRLERQGIPLVLDAGALDNIQTRYFNGFAVLTPHPGEAERLSGIPKEEILTNPLQWCVKTAKRFNAIVILKTNVLYLAAPDARQALCDISDPRLSCGGSGDFFSGIVCAQLALEKSLSQKLNITPDYFGAVCRASWLFAKAAASIKEMSFFDPISLAHPVSHHAAALFLES